MEGQTEGRTEPTKTIYIYLFVTLRMPEYFICQEYKKIRRFMKTVYEISICLLHRHTLLIKVKKDCLWKQRTHKITKIGDTVGFSLFIIMQHCSLRGRIRLKPTRKPRAMLTPIYTGLEKSGYQVNTFLISSQKLMLWVLIRSTPNRCF